MSSPSTKLYKPVQHHDDNGIHHDNDSDHDSDHEEEQEAHPIHEDITQDSDFHHIRIENSDDSDDRTEPTSNIHAFSFDLDEEESELQRYRLRTTSSSSSRHDAASILSKKITMAALWQAYLEARAENRRRRAERLLAMNDSPHERLFLCVSSWCDLTDRGCLLYGLLLCVWIGLCHAWKEERTGLVLVGLCFFVLRLAWRPAYWCIWGRRLEQKRQETMAIYDELNGSGDWHGADQQPPQEDANMLVV